MKISNFQMNEWDNDNVIMCGTSDGIVKIYSCVVFENDGSVSEHPALENPNSNSNENHDRSAAIAARLEKQRKRLKNSSTTATSSSVSGSGSASLTSPGPASPSAGGSRATNIDVGGAQFVRVLVQRTALTMHTAFNRPDNVHPAPITAIAPSR